MQQLINDTFRIDDGGDDFITQNLNILKEIQDKYADHLRNTFLALEVKDDACT